MNEWKWYLEVGEEIGVGFPRTAPKMVENTSKQDSQASMSSDKWKLVMSSHNPSKCTHMHRHTRTHTLCSTEKMEGFIKSLQFFFCLAELWQLTSLTMLPTEFCALSPCVEAHALLIGTLLVNNYISLSNTESMVLCFSITSQQVGPFRMVRATWIKHSTVQPQPS